jgi:hypothetical protein
LTGFTLVDVRQAVLSLTPALVVSTVMVAIACGGSGAIQGRISIAVADDFENNRSEYFYGLTSDNGTYFELLFDETNVRDNMLSFVNVCFGGVARVTGRITDGDKVHVRSLKFLDGPTRESTTEHRFTACHQYVGQQIGD